MLPLSTLWQKQVRTQPQYLKNTCLAGLQHGKNHRCLQVGRDGTPNQKLGRPVMWNGKSSSVWQIRCCLEIQKTPRKSSHLGILQLGWCTNHGIIQPFCIITWKATTSGPLVKLMPCYAMPLGPKKAVFAVFWGEIHVHPGWWRGGRMRGRKKMEVVWIVAE